MSRGNAAAERAPSGPLSAICPGSGFARADSGLNRRAFGETKLAAAKLRQTRARRRDGVRDRRPARRHLGWQVVVGRRPDRRRGWQGCEPRPSGRKYERAADLSPAFTDTSCDGKAVVDEVLSVGPAEIGIIRRTVALGLARTARRPNTTHQPPRAIDSVTGARRVTAKPRSRRPRHIRRR